MVASTNLGMLFPGFLLAGLGSSVSGAAYQAYLPDHLPAAQYGEASGYIGAMTMLGTVVSFGVAGVLVSPGVGSPFYLATIVVVATGVAVTALAIPEPDALHGAQPGQVA